MAPAGDDEPALRTGQAAVLVELVETTAPMLVGDTMSHALALLDAQGPLTPICSGRSGTRNR